jgi:hypothetical protein
MKIAISIVLAFAAGLGMGFVLHDQIASVLPLRGEPPAVRVDIFATVDRAAVAMEQSLRVGVNLLDFSERVREVATEVALAERAIVTPQERAIWQEYSDATENARDIVTAWNISVHDPLMGIQGFFTVPDDLFEKYSRADAFGQQTWRLNPHGNLARGNRADIFRQYVWEFGRKHLENARSLTNASQAKR